MSITLSQAIEYQEQVKQILNGDSTVKVGSKIEGHSELGPCYFPDKELPFNFYEAWWVLMNNHELPGDFKFYYICHNENCCNTKHVECVERSSLDKRLEKNKLFCLKGHRVYGSGDKPCPTCYPDYQNEMAENLLQEKKTAYVNKEWDYNSYYDDIEPPSENKGDDDAEFERLL